MDSKDFVGCFFQAGVGLSINQTVRKDCSEGVGQRERKGGKGTMKGERQTNRQTETDTEIEIENLAGKWKIR